MKNPLDYFLLLTDKPSCSVANLKQNEKMALAKKKVRG
jgi:hypothetical protein